jgi:hypothetical protein
MLSLDGIVSVNENFTDAIPRWDSIRQRQRLEIVSRVLALLNSPAFKSAPAGNPVSMEAVIQANRTAWGD